MERYLPYIIICVLVLMYLNARFSKKILKPKVQGFPYKAVPIMTKTEKLFFDQLIIALPTDYFIFCKVRLWDIIDTTATEKKYLYTNKIQSKHVDFVIADSSTNVVLVIELDDKSHNQSKRMERDEFVDKALESAGIEILRYRTTGTYDFTDLKNAIKR